MTKLESIEKSNDGTHKYTATFCICKSANPGGCIKEQKKEVHFGARGYLDYTMGATDGQRANYIGRHRKNENFEDPLTAASLSRWILWGSSRDIDENIKNFKKKFDI